MDRYDRIMRDVIERTENGLLRWGRAPRNFIQNCVLNPDQVFLAHWSDYDLSGQIYHLLFAEKRYGTKDSFGRTVETTRNELIVLDTGNEAVLSLFDGLVDREDLAQLASAIFEHNEHTKQFFEAFDAASVA